MKTRKTILLGVIAVLACIYIVQIVTSHRSPVKEYKLSARPDTITFVSKANGTVKLSEENGVWVAGDKKYIVDTSTAESILADVQHIKSLGVVSHSTADGVNDQYGLNDDAKITVTASKDGKNIRTFTVGKASSTGSQTYIRMENSSDTLLASGSLHDSFGKSLDALRSKDVYTCNAADISEVTVDLGSESYTLSKSTGDKPVWTLAAGSAKGAAASAPAPDSEKITSWVAQLTTLKVSNWAEDNEQIPAKHNALVTMKAGTKNISVTVAKVGSGDDVKYLCSSSETNYPFYLSSYTAERYMKKLSDLKK